MSREKDEEDEELYPADEQGIEEKEKEISEEEDIESHQDREEMMADNAITPVEDAFMEGAEKGGKGGKCSYCGKVLEEETLIEEEFDDEVRWFCSERCAEKYAGKYSTVK
ncbi:MAG: hypothetical protein QW331_03970 [Candidatus Woesearchaeota archaeon]